MEKHHAVREIANWESRLLHRVSAWAFANRLVLGQEATAEKSNEITAIPKLLELLDLKDCIITIDAMGCQTAIAKQIVGVSPDDSIVAQKKDTWWDARFDSAFNYEYGISLDYLANTYDRQNDSRLAQVELRSSKSWNESLSLRRRPNKPRTKPSKPNRPRPHCKPFSQTVPG